MSAQAAGEISPSMGPLVAPTTDRDRLVRLVREAARAWRLFEGVERLGIGLSGGADSLAMLDVMTELAGQPVGSLSSERFPADLIAVHVDQYSNVAAIDTLSEFVQAHYGMDLVVVPGDARDIAKGLLAQGKAPCRGCAPIRAAALGVVAAKLDLQAMALGHHLTDVMATFLMNAFHRAELETMPPRVFRSQNRRIPIIRPLFLAEQTLVKANSPVAPAGLFNCGMCSLHATERQMATAYVDAMFAAHKPAAERAREVVARVGAPRHTDP